MLKKAYKYKKTNVLYKSILFLILSNIFINSFFASMFNKFSSDSIWGNILIPYFFKSKVYINLDTYLLHYPITLISQYFFNSPNIVIFANIFISLVLTLVFYFIFYSYFIKIKIASKNKIYFLPIFLLINFSWIFYTLLAQPYIRNIEFGIIFLILIYYDRILKSNRVFIRLIVYVLLLLVILSDPYFLYLFIVPLILVLASKLKIDDRYIQEVMILISICLLSYIIRFFIINSNLFVIFNINQNTVTGKELIKNLNLLIEGIEYIIGIQKSFYLTNLFKVIIFVLGSCGIFLMLKAYWIKKDIILGVIPISFLATFTAYLFSVNTTDLDTSRYLMFIFFILPFGLVFLLFKLPIKTIRILISAIIFIVVVLNFITINATFYKKNTSNQYLYNNEIISAVNRNNFNYGYTSYWNAAINTFLSNNKIKFRQVVCYKHKIYPYFWVSADQWYMTNKKVKKTFLLIDFNKKLTPELNGCSLVDLKKQFGQPYKINTIFTSQGNLSLLEYKYNIASKFSKHSFIY